MTYSVRKKLRNVVRSIAWFIRYVLCCSPQGGNNAHIQAACNMARTHVVRAQHTYTKIQLNKKEGKTVAFGFAPARVSVLCAHTACVPILESKKFLKEEKWGKNTTKYYSSAAPFSGELLKGGEEVEYAKVLRTHVKKIIFIHFYVFPMFDPLLDYSLLCTHQRSPMNRTVFCLLLRLRVGEGAGLVESLRCRFARNF